MKALSPIKLPRVPNVGEEARRSNDTNEFLLNKNFKQLQEALRDVEKRILALETEE